MIVLGVDQLETHPVYEGWHAITLPPVEGVVLCRIVTPQDWAHRELEQLVRGHRRATV